MKNIVFVDSDGTVYSFPQDKLLAVKGAGVAVAFFFNSDDNSEIYQVVVLCTDNLSFFRDFQDQLSYSKQESIVVLDAVKNYSFSNHITKTSEVAFSAITSPVVFNNSINTQYTVSAGTLTAVDDLQFGGALISGSTLPPTVLRSDGGDISVEGSDNAGIITIDTSGLLANGTITVSYTGDDYDKRIPIISSNISISLVSQNASGFQVRALADLPVGFTFNYFTVVI